MANTAGHALAGAVIAYLQGGSVAGGAAGAAAGELAAKAIASELYPGIKPENLTNDQKANVSALSTLAAGLAGGVAGNSALAGVHRGTGVADTKRSYAGCYRGKYCWLPRNWHGATNLRSNY
ncbi:VENN motif pre-toxin domain-containing protein [Rahnella sp. AA]|uniref:VENN motif pre-toxin domain-containing protein n=1 Tax=Rahnella sp. AA TaxID=2057180 RepID=UPI001E63C807|nr:VENN motif pre-toxin domain-containing protein [Rahnella sp. AA]